MTLTEWMIILVIIGLLAAMAIPAFSKVRTNTIARAYIEGQTLTTSQIEWLENHSRDLSPAQREAILRMNGQRKSEVNGQIERYITVDGVRYRLVPAN